MINRVRTMSTAEMADIRCRKNPHTHPGHRFTLASEPLSRCHQRIRPVTHQLLRSGRQRSVELSINGSGQRGNPLSDRAARWVTRRCAHCCSDLLKIHLCPFMTKPPHHVGRGLVAVLRVKQIIAAIRLACQRLGAVLTTHAQNSRNTISTITIDTRRATSRTAHPAPRS